MRCQCGEEFLSPNQKYCYRCGRKNPYLMLSRMAGYQPSSAQYAGPPGPYSIICLFLALFSLFMVIISIGIGTGFSGNIIFYNSNSQKIFLLGVEVLMLNFIGLSAAITSRISSDKAGKFEPINNIEKVGGVFSIFGIVINSFAMIGAIYSVMQGTANIFF